MYIEKWFRFVGAQPYIILALSAILVVGLSLFLPRLQKDTSPDAYIEPDNPALIYRDTVKKIFGLDDPFVIAIEAPVGQTIYEPDGLRLIVAVTELMKDAENIDRKRVVSLTTESIAEGTAEELYIAPAFETPPTDAAEIANIRGRIEGYSPFIGRLVAEDGSMTLVVGEMIDQDRSRETFQELTDGLDQLRTGYPGTLHLAGEASTAGYLDDYITADARRQLPIAALLIMIVLAVCFRSASGVLLPFSVAAAAALCAVGIRALLGVPFYAISNALVVIIISISVADAIHILTEYKEELRSGRFKTTGEALTVSMTAIFRPITLTTFTTIGGFVGIWFGTDMPPMKAFGSYASVGVFVAWAFSVSFLPACLTLLHRGKAPEQVSVGAKDSGQDISSKILSVFSQFVVRHSGPVLFIGGGVLIGSVWLATLVTTDYSRIENFATNEPIRIADTRVNEALDGTYRMLVVIDALEPQGLTKPEVLHKIADLQEYALSLPHINGASSIVDILKEVNKGTAGGDTEHHIIPDDPDSVAQLFLVYEALGNPADLEDAVDFDRQLALVELRTNASSFSLARPLVEELERYLVEEFNSDEINGSLSGRVYLNHHWLSSIEANHLISVAVAILLALIIASATFGSITAGLYCLFHVVFAVFMVYAIMGLFSIPLSIATAMFAAITIGVGIDFSIHSVERVQMLATAAGKITPETIHEAFQTTGRALLYNLFALCLGFSALLASNNPTIVDFATLLIVAVAANFIASMTVLPAFMLQTKPGFLIETRNDTDAGAPGKLAGAASAGLILAFAASFAFLSIGGHAHAQEFTAEEIVKNITDRDEGVYLTRDFKMTLIDRNGKSRERMTKGLRIDTDTARRSLISFTGPANLKDTAFLSFDYFELGAETDNWLYLPALRRTRRIAGADRGQYFLGTDFTYDDIRKESGIGPEDYDFTIATKEESPENSEEEATGNGLPTLNGIPKSSEIAKELGYSRVLIEVDPANWMPQRWRLFDLDGKHFKTITFKDHVQVDGIWTQKIIHGVNHDTGHESIFEFSNIDFTTEVDAGDLTQRALERGTH